MKPRKTAKMDDQKRESLPQLAKPMVYTIKLHPRFDNDTFSGVVEIGFEMFPSNDRTDHSLTVLLVWLLYTLRLSIVSILIVLT